MVERHGVIIIGSGNWSGQVSRDASNMYSNNLYNLIEDYWDSDQKNFVLELEDEILSGCLITHAGEIVNAPIKQHYA